MATKNETKKKEPKKGSKLEEVTKEVAQEINTVSICPVCNKDFAFGYVTSNAGNKYCSLACQSTKE